jgi:hypothetical protein
VSGGHRVGSKIGHCDLFFTKMLGARRQWTCNTAVINMLNRKVRFGTFGVVSLSLAIVGVATAALGGCSASGVKGGGFGDGNPDGSPIIIGADGGPTIALDGSSGDGSKPASETKLYAHTNKKLYQLDTKDLSNLKDLGEFDCIQSGAGSQFTSMTDIAVDRDGKLYGVAENAVFLDMQVTATGVTCGTKVILKTPGKFFGASMAPVGALYPNREALLIADSNGDIYDVDTATGGTTIVGNFGVVPKNDGRGTTYPTKTQGKPWALSGDIVFLENSGNPIAYATVRDCEDPTKNSTCNTTDTLIQLDPKLLGPANKKVTTAVRGAIKKASSCNDKDNASYGSMYGIAAFDDQIIGFSRTTLPNGGGVGAFIVKISSNDGKACLVEDVGAQINAGWAGAGVTTVVSVVAPPIVN